MKKIMIFLIAAALGMGSIGMAGCFGKPKDDRVKPDIYDLHPRAAVSEGIKLTVNGTSVPVEEYLSAAYSRFALDGAMDISVKYSSEYNLDKVLVYPLSAEIDFEVTEDNELKFSLPSAQKIMIRTYRDEILMLLMDRTRFIYDAPDGGNVLSASDYDFDISGATDDTAVFNKMLGDFKSDASKNVLHFPAGRYVSASYLFHDFKDKTVVMDTGAYFDMAMPTAPTVNIHTLQIYNCENFAILGNGLLDAKGREILERDGTVRPDHNARALQIRNTKGLTVEGLTVRGARNSSFLCDGGDSENFVIRNVKLIAPKEIAGVWLDGFNLTSVKGVLVEDCMSYLNDDCFASGHYYTGTSPSTDFVVRNYVAYTNFANGLRIGWNSTYDMLNYTFDNTEVYGYTRAFLILHELKNGAKYDTVTVKNTTVRTSMSGGDLIEFVGEIDIERIVIENVKFITVSKFNLKGSEVEVVFKNVTMNGEKITQSNYKNFFKTGPLDILNVRFED